MKTNRIEMSKSGKGKTMYVPLSVYPGTQDISKNLTISVPGKYKIKTSLTDNGLRKFRDFILEVYGTMIQEQ